MNTKNWYIIQTKPNSYRKAKINLERQGFQTFIPLETVTKRVQGKFVNKINPLFPGYMFVNFDYLTDPWQKVNSTIGVSRLISFDNKIRPVPEIIIETLTRREKGYFSSEKNKYLKKGSQVKLLKGPFADFMAIVEDIEADKRIWLLLDCMGSNIRIETIDENLM